MDLFFPLTTRGAGLLIFLVEHPRGRTGTTRGRTGGGPDTDRIVPPHDIRSSHPVPTLYRDAVGLVFPTLVRLSVVVALRGSVGVCRSVNVQLQVKEHRFRLE